jgi:hypothetical protein
LHFRPPPRVPRASRQARLLRSAAAAEAARTATGWPTGRTSASNAPTGKKKKRRPGNLMEMKDRERQ